MKLIFDHIFAILNDQIFFGKTLGSVSYPYSKKPSCKKEENILEKKCELMVVILWALVTDVTGPKMKNWKRAERPHFLT